MSGDSLSSRSLDSVGLPPMVFFWTIDQIASMLNISEETVRLKYLFYSGRSTGIKKRHHMQAINIAPEDESAEWRVSAREFVMFLKRMGLKTYEITHLNLS